jgi:hypothetical protein
MVISLIGAPLADDEAAAELEELELLLPQATAPTELTIVIASTARRCLKASPPSSNAGQSDLAAGAAGAT